MTIQKTDLATITAETDSMTIALNEQIARMQAEIDRLQAQQADASFASLFDNETHNMVNCALQIEKRADGGHTAHMTVDLGALPIERFTLSYENRGKTMIEKLCQLVDAGATGSRPRSWQFAYDSEADRWFSFNMSARRYPVGYRPQGAK